MYSELSRSCLSQPDDPTAVVVNHVVRPLGYVVDSVCGCVKSACCALGATDHREAAGYRYVPTPIDTSKMKLPVNDKLVSARTLFREEEDSVCLLHVSLHTALAV